MKICVVCGESKPADREHFYKHRNGLHSKCKVCYGEYQAKRQSTPEAKAKRANRLAIQRDCINARQRTYYMANQDKMRAWYNEYHRNRPEENAHRVNRRRALKTGNGGHHTREEWEALKAQYDNTCVYPSCHSSLLTRDHVVPLCKGGTDDITNIQPLCRPHNSQKSSRIQDYRFV